MMHELLPISVVIPTYNRSASLARTIDAINRQTSKPGEVIVIDAGNEHSYREKIALDWAELNVIIVDSEASVCIQRNKGIVLSKYKWIFLCDDDIELPDDYLTTLFKFVSENLECNAVAGLLLQKEGDKWISQYPPTSGFDLIFRFIFQHSIWGNVESIKARGPLNILLQVLKNNFKKKGNTFTKAGWPSVTQWKGEVWRTSIYSLGANLIRREWLIQSPYDEVLDPGGIGDNYGVALGFPHEKSIYVLSSAYAYHHRDEKNRPEASVIYYRRIMALDYFNQRYRKGISYKLWLIWSLFGNLILFLIRGNAKMLQATIVAMMKIILSKNPYWVGYKSGIRLVSPNY
ncbi:MAG TPA: hypothetical protein DIW27_02475 [Cytophagales bacterium]|nr:hypothetical protein [Cytophagales bacterium]